MAAIKFGNLVKTSWPWLELVDYDGFPLYDKTKVIFISVSTHTHTERDRERVLK